MAKKIKKRAAKKKTKKVAKKSSKKSVRKTTKKKTTRRVVKKKSKQKDWMTTLLLCIFTGNFGGHKFYTGHRGLAVVHLFTFGCCGLWTLWDLYQIITENFTDSEGRKLKQK